MTITTITIATVDYVSYASVAEADARLAVDASRAATWAAKTTDEKGALLVQATNRLDLLMYAGTKTGTEVSQPNKFPRTNLTYASGEAVSTSEVPKGIESATILLAGSIALDADAGDAGSSGSNVKNVKAGSTGVTFFRQTTGVPLADETSYALVKEFLEGSTSSSAVGNMSSGTDPSDEYAKSSFEDRDAWGRQVGFP
ncbi:head-tail adaptor Ad1 [Roseobacter phage RDJL Phi 2]|uniref:Putative DnaT-like domain-containing protein n=1 Tax=Roseobacter phage RDJL Phi 2 TaxID=1682380 RepID=A0A0K0PVJ0_9CAUD|nr:head-tail adaptor Ad1 [Roseobacter phage RDJL Phi 2]AKQ75847.1 hypothetical protein RDJLphi2_gp57 [Roseobacter phage RDJL Phi 2]